MRDTDLSPAAARVPVKMGDFLSTMEIIKGTLVEHKDRLNALDGGGPAKGMKPRVRVGAKSYVTQDWGDTYETTDGINFRLVNYERR
jgi:hypothetical protein